MISVLIGMQLSNTGTVYIIWMDHMRTPSQPSSNGDTRRMYSGIWFPRCGSDFTLGRVNTLCTARVSVIVLGCAGRERGGRT